MIILKKIFHKINSLFSNKIKLNQSITRNLSLNKINILDVGAAGLNHKNKFYNSFNRQITKVIKADDILTEQKQKNEQQINTLLWSENIKKNFYVTKNKVSSSLFRINDEILKDFKNFEEHKITEIKEVSTRKIKDIKEIDKCNFLKLDAEGAELEIMKGMDNKINNILGIEIEIQFINRYIGSPNFTEVNKFLEENGFELYLMNSESWIRNKKFYNSSSNHKVIWGDMIYFKSFEELERLFKSNVDQNLIEKFIALLLLYKFFDEANFLIKKLYKEKLISHEMNIQMQKFVENNIQLNFIIFFKSFMQLIFALIIFPFTFIINRHREAGISFLKISLRNFFYNLGDIFKVSDKKNSVIRDTKL